MKHAAALLLLLSSPPALSLEAPAAGMSFSALDADRDGAISAREARRSLELATRFDAADLNGDGHLDRAEFARQSGPGRRHS